MQLMQYEITLPADYDMGIIRARVAAKGPLLDGFPGLGTKAYLVRERGVAGSPVNQYAPFYLWTAPKAMNAFLCGPGFQGLVDDFGRPEVRHWAGLAYEEGEAAAATPVIAVRRHERVPAGAAPGEVLADAVGETARLARRDGAVYAALGVDPCRWELVHFSAWAHEEPTAPGEVFRILHLSAPERDRLPRGRQW